ncbi:hypothetical protein MSAN_01343500 [Mycena sanguinolenta]|uniref:F-box domain-containing protein n=1 Tax=Mycena sanguinolenta TaxID=230812 RepID=A0A8H6YD20_9AGAR|nr:hypothetical protein MSAN_01343500 [Mycena sanguinolenta]
MTLTSASVRVVLLEQKERTRRCSKAEIERIIQESKLEIISLDSKIDALVGRDSQLSEAQISSLIGLHDSQRACVLALKYIASPIYGLPVELLVEIFEHAIEDETHIRDVYRITQVCSDWREIAHRTPRLWTRLLKIGLCTEQSGEGLKAWLSRSAPLPLRICFIRQRHDFRDVNRGTWEEALKAAPRFHAFKFYSASETPSAAGLGNALPIPYESTMPVFTAPRLRKLTLKHVGAPVQVVVPWTQLTELTLRCNWPEATFEVLSRCANLITASITFRGFEWSLPAAKHNLPIRFRQLHALTLCLKSDTHPLDHLSTPVLQKLQLALESQRFTVAHLTEFQLRAPNITSLEITKPSALTSTNLITIVRHAPSLTHLKLTQCDNCFNDNLIRALHYYDDVPPLAPCLHDLFVCNDRVMDFDEEVLAGMLASRWWSDTEFAADPVLPPVTRWTRVELQFELGFFLRHHFGTRFTDIVKDIPSHVLIHSKEPVREYVYF